MPRARQTKVVDQTHTGGVWDFVIRDKKKPEEGFIPNIVFEDILGIRVYDLRQYEIVKLKNISVTESNIKSVENVYGDKYHIGDNFQEWVPLYGTTGCYPGTLENCLNWIKRIMTLNSVSQLKEEDNIQKIVDIIADLDKRISKFLDVNYKGIKEIEQK